MSSQPQTLRRSDYLLLVTFCLTLFSFPLFYNRTFSTHETIHCVNIREMISSGNWIIPHFGDRPWLERPPLPFWLTIPVVSLLGDIPASYRIPPLLAGTLAIVLVSWMASLWYGRRVGLLSGLVLATIREMTHYSTAPECDVFLCAVVISAIALFVALEFRPRRALEDSRFLGKRPWLLLVFFAVLGLTNLVKGLYFGTVMVLVPVACYFLVGNNPWALLRRYLWLPGWLAFALTASSWALAAYVVYPDIVDFWTSDYVGRLSRGYLREPVWYYLANLPWALFPWPIAVGIGIAASRRRFLGQGRTPERFLLCWGVAVLAVLSIPQGKHHHYLLHSLAPWAIFAALGTVRFWEWLQRTSPHHLLWAFCVILTLFGEIALLIAAQRVQASPSLVIGTLIAWPVALVGLTWSATQRNSLVAASALLAILLVGHWGGHTFLGLLDDRYADDRAFVRQVKDLVPKSTPLLILDDIGPLDPSWMAFYLDGQGKLLHNPTFLYHDSITTPDVYLVGRANRAAELAPFGFAQVILQSRRSRDGSQPEQLFCLFHLHFRPGLPRHHGPVYISPMQAVGRAPGPFLNPQPIAHREPAHREPANP